MAEFSTDLNASSTSPPLKAKTTKNKNKRKGNNRNDSEATINTTKKNEHDPNETSKSSSQKPQLKIVRNNLGSLVILFFGVLLDLVIL